MKNEKMGAERISERLLGLIGCGWIQINEDDGNAFSKWIVAPLTFLVIASLKLAPFYEKAKTRLGV